MITTTAPVDWLSPSWGDTVHIGSFVDAESAEADS